MFYIAYMGFFLYLCRMKYFIIDRYAVGGWNSELGNQ